VPDPFLALADPRRRRILDLLRGGELTAGDIAGRFDVSWPAISRHLRVLKAAGLVRERREGRERRYSLDPARLQDAVGRWVLSFDARWQDALARLRTAAEQPLEDR
jgi:DNA-binding transcriptional ArsR family regulator